MGERAHKEYEEYMKQITDNFVAMQSDEMIYLDIEWTGGLTWNKYKSEEISRDRIIFEEKRKYNSEIARKYLNENILTFEQWFKKYKTN